MAKTPWSDEDQIIALYLARRGSVDTEIATAFLKLSAHSLKSLNMAISNFRYLLDGKGLANVSARQRRISKELGDLPLSKLRARAASILGEAHVAPNAVSTEGTSSGRRLTDIELEKARKILALVRTEIGRVANGDEGLLWALRRKVCKELGYDERSKPMTRRWIKAKLFVRQKGLCADCQGNLPEKYSVLDRHEAMKGYSEENCRVICSTCDRKTQKRRGYA